MPLGERRSAFNETGMLDHCDAEAAPLPLVRGRNYAGARKHHQPRLPRSHPERKVAHRHYRIPDSRRQGIPFADDRLLRWHGDQLVNQHAARR